jgi:hypothetical protein
VAWEAWAAFYYEEEDEDPYLVNQVHDWLDISDTTEDFGPYTRGIDYEPYVELRVRLIYSHGAKSDWIVSSRVKIGKQAALQNIVLTVELLHFLAVSNQSPDACLGVESGDTGTACPHPLGQRTLRTKLDFQLARQILPFKFLILTHVGRDHFPDLPRAQQLAESFAINACVVAGDGQALHSAGDDRINQSFGNAAQSESASCDQHVVFEQAGQCCGGVGEELFHRMALFWGLDPPFISGLQHRRK